MTDYKAHSFREVTPLRDEDCFSIFDRERKKFDFPVHFHPEYELNLMLNADGAKRIVGDNIEYINDFELVLVGPNIMHGWEKGKTVSQNIREVTIQFDQNLYPESFLKKSIAKPIKDMFDTSYHGILFTDDVVKTMAPKIIDLVKKNGFDSYIGLTTILFDLATSRNQTILSTSINKNDNYFNSEKLKIVYEYIKDHYEDQIKLEDMAQMLNMTVVSFSRFIKQRTGKTFIDFVNDFKLGQATRLLMETDLSISEVAFKSGFNNIGYFNRIFKNAKSYTPSEFRQNINGIKRIR